MKKLIAESYMAFEFDDKVGASYRKRLRTDNPTDKDGKPCKNGVASMFGINFK